MERSGDHCGRDGPRTSTFELHLHVQYSDTAIHKVTDYEKPTTKVRETPSIHRIQVTGNLLPR
jgi:hypothetical protein